MLRLWRVFYTFMTWCGFAIEGTRIGVSPMIPSYLSHGHLRLRTPHGIVRCYFTVDRPRQLYKPSSLLKHDLLHQCARMGLEVMALTITTDGQNLVVRDFDLHKSDFQSLQRLRNFYRDMRCMS